MTFDAICATTNPGDKLFDDDRQEILISADAAILLVLHPMVEM